MDIRYSLHAPGATTLCLARHVPHNIVDPFPIRGRERTYPLDLWIAELDGASLDVDEQLDVFRLSHDGVGATAEERLGLRFDEVELLEREVRLEERILQSHHGESTNIET